MLMLNRGSVTALGMEATGESLMLGFCPLASEDAKRHSAPMPERLAPEMLSLSDCSTSVGFKTVTVSVRRSLVHAATTSSGNVSLPAFTTGCSPPGGSVGLGCG